MLIKHTDNTFQTYNTHATEYLSKFSAIGVREKDIDEVFSYITKENPSVLEYGCAGGREASYILTKTNIYIGIDYVQEFTDEARRNNQEGTFYCEDMLSYTIKSTVDIVFAFASFLHLSKEELRMLCRKIDAHLAYNGLLRISLKTDSQYRKEEVTDAFGTRVFYFYDKATLLSIMPSYTILFERETSYGGDIWLEMLFQRKTLIS